jgi:hypothetical protein
MRNVILGIVLLLGVYETRALVFIPRQIISACDMSTTSCSSSMVDMSKCTVASIQAKWTGATSWGSFSLALSNDTTTNPLSVSALTTYAGTVQDVSGASSFVYNLSNAGYHWLQMYYTKTGGAGTLNATFACKGDGGKP